MMTDDHDNEIDDPLHRFFDARLERADKSSPKLDREITQNMWRAVSDHLKSTRGLRPLDEEVVDWLNSNISELLANQLPSDVKRALRSKRGAPSDSLVVKDSQYYAVVYVQAVNSGDIQDKSPMKAIGESYSCDEQTVRSWVKNYRDDLWSEFRADDDIKSAEKRLKRLLKAYAKIYDEQSRAQSAILKRDRKSQSK